MKRPVDVALDDIVQRRLLLLRLENQLANAVERSFQEVRRWALDRLTFLGGQSRLSQLELNSFAAEVKDRVRQTVEIHFLDLSSDLTGLYDIETESTINTLTAALSLTPLMQEALPNVVAPLNLDTQQMKQFIREDLQALTPEVIETVSAPIVKAVQRARRDAIQAEVTAGTDTDNTPVSSGLLAGLNVGGALLALSPVVQRGFDRAASTVSSVTRTKVQQTAVQAQSQVYRVNTHLIKGEQFTAMLDIRTCPVCAKWHGTTFWREAPPEGFVGKNRPFSEKSRAVIPIHFNCRCMYLPVFYEVTRLVTGDAALEIDGLDGKTPAVLTFDAWLRRQPLSKQREALGPARFELWKTGKAKIEDLSEDNRVLNLQQLREKLGIG